MSSWVHTFADKKCLPHFVHHNIVHCIQKTIITSTDKLIQFSITISFINRQTIKCNFFIQEIDICGSFLLPVLYYMLHLDSSV